jgi:pimeloyl-ACP methyl ester carboxylesterase
MFKLRAPMLPIAAITLLLIACGDDPAPNPSPRPDMDVADLNPDLPDAEDRADMDIDLSEDMPVTPEVLPRFEPRPCPAPVPTGLIDGQNVSCGALFVRQDRRGGAGRSLELAVTIVRGAADPEPEPIVHLIGGPGGAMASYDQVLGTSFGLPLSVAAKRDLILFDQRGTGRSVPRLSCLDNETLTVCDARLRADGILLESFHTEESAADIEDLRVALRLPAIHLYGQSYGTSLALTYARLFPEGAKTLFLESTSSVAHDAALTNSARSFELALGRVFAECRADEACEATFPELEARFGGLLDALPPGNVNANALLEAIDLLLQLSQGVSYVPLLIHSLLIDDMATVQAIAGFVGQLGQLQQEVLANGFNPLLFQTKSCYDYGPLLTNATDRAVNGEVHPVIRAAFPSQFAFQRIACSELPNSYVSEAVRQPVSSELPALLLGGTHDNNTPIEIAERVLQTLPRGHLLRWSGWGHVILPFGDACARAAYVAFLDDPSRAPAPSCLAEQRARFALEAP